MKMDENAHFFLPIHGREELEMYGNDFRFILVANNPGSVLLVRRVTSESVTESIKNLVLSIWPVLLVVILMGSIFGAFLWLAVIQILFLVSKKYPCLTCKINIVIEYGTQLSRRAVM